MRYSSPELYGIIEPHSSAQVPVTLEAQLMGEQDTVARVAVLGSEGSPLVSPQGSGPLCDSAWWAAGRQGCELQGSFLGKGACNS